jgi:hypothetical protein
MLELNESELQKKLIACTVRLDFSFNICLQTRLSNYTKLRSPGSCHAVHCGGAEHVRSSCIIKHEHWLLGDNLRRQAPTPLQIATINIAVLDPFKKLQKLASKEFSYGACEEVREINKDSLQLIMSCCF